MTGLCYRISPPMAQSIAEHPNLEPIVRAGIVPAFSAGVVLTTTLLMVTAGNPDFPVPGSVAVTVSVASWRGRGGGYS